MEIPLIRHGDPDYVNDCLTDTGRKEANCLADALVGQAIEHIYVSPMGRARETCGFTADRTNVSPVILDWLAERPIIRAGLYLWEAPGETFLRSTEDGSHFDWFNLRDTIPEGLEQSERIRRGFDALLADVLHGPLPMIFISLEIHPTGVTSLRMIEHNHLAHFKATAINDLAHLQ